MNTLGVFVFSSKRLVESVVVENVTWDYIFNTRQAMIWNIKHIVLPSKAIR